MKALFKKTDAPNTKNDIIKNENEYKNFLNEIQEKMEKRPFLFQQNYTENLLDEAKQRMDEFKYLMKEEYLNQNEEIFEDN